MAQPNPWGENWHNENYSSAEMDQLLGKIFGAKLTFMGFLPAGDRKWVKKRNDDAMEVISLHSDRGFIFYANFGLSFPWIPHGNFKTVCWHRTPKSALIDLRYERPTGVDWSLPKGRTVAAERAQIVSAEICETCGPWFSKMLNQDRLLEELKRLRTRPGFINYVQCLTVDLFWRARVEKRCDLAPPVEAQLRSYFGEDGFLKVKCLLEQAETRSA